ncbi:MAG: tyrosine--tRNA ligase [Armatimonadota bacterium]
MLENVLETLRERGFYKQCTDEEALGKLLASETVTCYAGFDPTADSLHVGHLIPMMALAHLQRAGHRAVALVGGGTAMVGDPSGKTEMRQLISQQQIQSNIQGVKVQIGKFLSLESDNGVLVDNADWLLSLNYIEFLRDIGRHFRVNEMIKAEGYRMRLEREEGLSFIEFNYQLLQAYDFLCLSRQFDCKLQFGGDDQWGNILAGVDLTRRVDGKLVFGLTFPLLTTAKGEKMGKTAGGAVWLDAEKTSPYDFYQYWINCDDRDVARFLAMFTFLPMDEVNKLGQLQDSDIRAAKEVLAFETTKLAHGDQEADKARSASHAAFGGGGADFDSIPSTTIAKDRIDSGIPVVDIFVEVGLTTSKSASRRLIEGGGAYIGGQQVQQIDATMESDAVEDGSILLRSGKKKYHRIIVE